MAFENNNFTVVKKDRLPKTDFSVECNLPISNASKILAVCLDACVGNYELISGSLSYSGTIDLKVVYASDEGEIANCNYSCPFNSKFEADNIINGQKAIICAEVIDYEVLSLSADNVKLLCTLEQSGYLISNQEIHTIATNDEDICYKSVEIGIIKFIGEALQVISTQSEVSARGNVKRMLLTESQVIVKNVESGTNFVSVSGDIVTRVLYVTDDDKFESSYINDSFKEEIELEGVSRDSLIEAFAVIKKDNVKTEIQESDKGTKIIVDIPIEITIKAYEEDRVGVINDLYSIANEIKVTTESFNMSKVCPMESVEGKIDGNLTLTDEQPRIDKVLFVGGNSVIISNSYVKENEIYIEGIAKSNVIYLNDETSTINSVQVEVPFVISDKFNNEIAEGSLKVDAIVTDVDISAKKGREIYYDAKIKAGINYCIELVSGVITEAVVLDAFPEKDYGMELIFAHAGQDSWDIAKEAKVKENQLILQNPEVLFPLSEDTSLVLFYQKVQ